MNWLARFFMDLPTERQQRLSDCYRWHKFIWECFPGRPDSGRDFLFRVDETPEGSLIHVLSEHEPVRPAPCPLENWQCKAVPPGFLDHAGYRFDVRCNPGRKQKVAGKKNSRREAVLGRENQEAWFLRKAGENGFSVAPGSLRIDPDRVQGFRKGEREGTHIGVRFSGLLAVTERELFRQAFQRGLGSARGFGFGMLLLAPVHNIFA